MSVKNIARAIAEKSVDYLRANGKNIAVTVLAETLDVPITTVSRNMYQTRSYISQTSTERSYPRNSAEAAIDSLYSTAKGMYSEARVYEIARKIYSIAKNSDDSTRVYAIKILERIQSKIYSESRKSDISMLIAELAMPVIDSQN